MTIFNHITGFAKWAIAMLCICCATSCESFFDNEGDCEPHYFVRFIFDHNLQFDDTFNAQVHSVELFVFDAQTDILVAHYTDAGEHLKNEGYLLPIDVKPGKYDLYAWCGLDNNPFFALEKNLEDIHTPQDLRVVMAREHTGDTAWSDANLNGKGPLFHGSTTATLKNEQGQHTTPIYLTKDTNNIVFSIQYQSGPINLDVIEPQLICENGYLDFDNSLLDDEPILYKPWDFVHGSVEMGTRVEVDGEDEDDNKGNVTEFMKMEFGLSRIMADTDTKINIFDTTNNNKQLLSFPLTEWATKFRTANYKFLSDQQYLDYQDNYDILVIISGSGLSWTMTEIVINGWHVMPNGDVNM